MIKTHETDYIYVHRFKVSSGKEHKEITKVYYSGELALDNHKLLGGDLLLTKVIHNYK